MEQVLLTHFHRDQCAAAPAWLDQGARVVVPFTERRFAEEADLQRAAYDIYDNYTSFFPCFGPGRDLWPTTHAHDYEVLACGDLLADSGHLPAYYWAQWRYMDFQGHVNLMESLRRVIDLDVELILPGHGTPFAPDRDALEVLFGQLQEIWERFYGRAYTPWTPQFVAVSDYGSLARHLARRRADALLTGHGGAVRASSTCGSPTTRPNHAPAGCGSAQLKTCTSTRRSTPTSCRPGDAR